MKRDDRGKSRKVGMESFVLFYFFNRCGYVFLKFIRGEVGIYSSLGRVWKGKFNRLY